MFGCQVEDGGGRPDREDTTAEYGLNALFSQAVSDQIFFLLAGQRRGEVRKAER